MIPDPATWTGSEHEHERATRDGLHPPSSQPLPSEPPSTQPRDGLQPPSSQPPPTQPRDGLQPLSSEPLPLSLLPGTASVDGAGRLSIGGVDVLELVNEVGTPVFIYDEAHLRRRCRQAREAFGPQVAYASKAFLCKAMAALAYEEGVCIDVSTGGELAVALAAGVPAERLVLHGNNKSAAELETALTVGVGRLVVDSFDEVDRLSKLIGAGGRRGGGAPGGRPVQVLVRVTPGIEAHTHEYVMTGQEDSKFGFGLASGAAAEAVERARQLGPAVELVGLHAHIGSQIFALESFEQELAVLAPFFDRLGLGELCVGGGLGVAYVAGEEAPSIKDWASAVRAAAARAGVPQGTTITAEPGRAIAAAAAVTCYEVGTIKELPGVRTYVSVDGGMSDNPRPVLYGSGYEAFLPRSVGAQRPRAVTVVGKHCESGDIVIRDARVPRDLAVGDVLATPVTGAYGHSMASNYNKVPRPPVVFVKEGSWRYAVRRETFEDLMSRDV